MLKQQWSIGNKRSALSGLEQLIAMVGQSGKGSSPLAFRLGTPTATLTPPAGVAMLHSSEGMSSPAADSYLQTFLSCLLKLGEWKIAGACVRRFSARFTC